MKNKIYVFIALMAVIAIVALIAIDDKESSLNVGNVEDNLSDVKPNADSDNSEEAQLSLSPLLSAKQRYQAAVLERESAEAALDELDEAVTELERRVDAIERRGDNPADHQDETLEDFKKIFVAYQDTEARLFVAEKSEEQALRALKKEQSKLEE